MSEVDKLINDLLQNIENGEKKHELINRIRFFSFDNIFDMLEVFVKVLEIPSGEQAKIDRFINAYAELYSAKAEVMEFIFTVIAGMNKSELKDFEKFIEEGF
jgi:hypothetical protein